MSVVSRDSGRSSRPISRYDPASVIIDLSRRRLGIVHDLSMFTRLQILDLSNNNLESVDGIDCCRELWWINLSNNKLKCLNGFSNFVAIGTLVLANNHLSWRALSAIQHLHVVHLVLQGNLAVCSDKYYREHAVDSFSNAWIVDGKFVSAYERIQNEQFFQKSALGQSPVRHKFKKDQFIPSSRKNNRVHGTFGRKATDLMVTFPVKTTHNIDMDKRRIRYISRIFEEDIRLFADYFNKDPSIFHESSAFLTEMVEAQGATPDQNDVCNMLTLLLLCSLEFTIPTHLLQETLENMKLTKYGPISTLNIFLLPKELRCIVAQVMFACTTLSFHTKTSSLQEHLFAAMQASVTELTRVSSTGKPDASYLAVCKLDRAGMNSYRSLLASELIYQMCLVATFYEVISEFNVSFLVSMASGDLGLPEKLSGLLQQERERGEELPVIYDILSALVCRAVNKHVAFLMKKLNKGAKRAIRYQLPVSRLVPQPLFSSSYLTSGRTPPSQRPSSVASVAERRVLPELGDQVVIGPQNIARVIAVPDSGLVQVQMQQIPVPNGGMSSVAVNPSEHYMYIDIKNLDWDRQKRQWRPKGTIGDVVTFQCDMEQLAKAAESINGDSLSLGAPEVAYQPSPRPLSAMMLEHHPAEMVRMFDAAGDEEFLEEISRSLQELRVPAGRSSPSDVAPEQTEGRLEGLTSEGGRTDSTLEKASLPIIRKTTSVVENRENEFEIESKAIEGNTDSSSTTSKAVVSSNECNSIRVSTNVNESDPPKAQPPRLVDEMTVKKLVPKSLKDKDPTARPLSLNINRTRNLSSGSHETVPLGTGMAEIKVPNLAVTRLPNGQTNNTPRINLESYRSLSRNGFFDENVSAYQRQRAEAWRAKTYITSDPPKNEDLFRPKRGFRLSRQEAGQWLGNGRDLFAEEQSKRPVPSYFPGWKQTTPSASARRILRRGETPTIHTPSSLLYDCYCRHPQKQVVCGDEQQLVDLQIPTPPVAVTPSSGSDYKMRRSSPRMVSSTPFGPMCFNCQAKESWMYQ